MKEMLVGLLNGLAIGLVVGGVSWIWRNDFILGVITFAAMLLNMVAAGIAGVLIPFGLKALRIDPALASAIMLTTVTDVVGFFLFLGLAALVVGYFPECAVGPYLGRSEICASCKNIREKLNLLVNVALL